MMLTEIVYERLASVAMATTDPIPIHFPDYTKGKAHITHAHTHGEQFNGGNRLIYMYTSVFIRHFCSYS